MDVVVVGDIICDEWRYVATNSHNPENAALCLSSRHGAGHTTPGGAGLLALCLQQLGARVTLFGQADNQISTHSALTVLADCGVNIENVVRDDNWYTPIKTRFLNSAGNVIVRHDTEGPPAGWCASPPVFALETFGKVAANAACVVVSDYDKGYLDSNRHVLVRVAARHATPVLVDCKAQHIDDFSGATVFKVNQKTAQDYARLCEATAADGSPCRVLHQRARPSLTVVTMGADGVCWRHRGKTRCASFPINHYVGNAVGAGDAFLAGMVVSFFTTGGLHQLSSGKISSALQLAHVTANHKLFSPVAELSWPSVLSEYFTGPGFRADTGNKLMPAGLFAAFSRACVNANKSVVFTNGCFDVLHAGHLHLLQKAKAKGDVLIVAVDSDENVKRLKGPDRPVQDEETRASILASMEIVDAVTIFSDNDQNETLRGLISKCRPHYLVKGGDYSPRECVGWEEMTNRPKPGFVFCCSLLPDVSTTAIINKFKGDHV